jgi:hypothetical protein
LKHTKQQPNSKNTKRKSSATSSKYIFSKITNFLRHLLWLDRSILGRIGVVLLAITVFITIGAYGVARWYQQKHANEPLNIGVTFVANYARYFDLSPEETMQAMIDDLGIKRFRLVTYWNIHEPEPDKYDFSELDWQFDKVEAAGGEVALAIGLRQPRWPECHGPDWAMAKSVPEWTEDLKEYMGVIIDRYKDRDVLVEYQLENEYLLSVFGECPDHSRERLIDEFNYVKAKDPTRPLIVNRSNNAVPSWPVRAPRADKVGAAVYKRVWDKTVTRRNFEYPIPAWFYAFLAGGTELTTGRESLLHELQMESWLSTGKTMKTASTEDLYGTFGPDDVATRLYYAKETGIRTIDMWGAEWWYHMKVNRDAPEIWDTVKVELENYR